MSKDISLKSIKIKPLISKLYKKYNRHFVFVAVIVVLVAYIFIVFSISRLANAEPTANQTSAANPLSIPQVDQQTINHIQSLESNNTQIHSLFDQARNNPFQE